MTAPPDLAAEGLPLYRRIALELQRDIQRRLPPGHQLAPEHELAQRFLVNRHTVRRAVDVLSDAGLLVRRHGLGTYVTEAPIDYSIAGRTRFTENLEAAGRRPASRILSRQIGLAASGVADKLKLAPGERVICIETLRLADDRPLCITSMHVPLHVAPDGLRGYRRGSLHAFIERSYGFSPRRSYSLITSQLPSAEDAVRLTMPANQPVLRVESVNVRPDTELPVEYSISRFRADRLQLRLDLDARR
jgi:GntR family transcriptional regulator, phosphonate transport system regulatory protein